MSDWTAERLDALPEGTVIEYLVDESRRCRSLKEGSRWRQPSGRFWWSERLIGYAEAGSIRVVSVPVESLLDPKTVQIASRDPHGAAFDWFADRTLRRAVAHITGETNV